MLVVFLPGFCPSIVLQLPLPPRLGASAPDFRNSSNIPCSSQHFSLKTPLFSYHLDPGLDVNPSNPLVTRIAGPFLTKGRIKYVEEQWHTRKPSAAGRGSEG